MDSEGNVVKVGFSDWGFNSMTYKWDPVKGS